MANNIDIVDGLDAATKIKSTDTAGVHTVHHNVDASALPTGAATSALQVTAADIDTALRATPLPVSATFWQATQPVSGSFWQATQPVSGTFWQATQPVSGTVGVSGTVPVSGTFWQATQPVSGTFWQATQPVSGTVALGAGAAAIGTVALTAGAAAIGTVALTAGAAAIGSVTVTTLPTLAAVTNLATIGTSIVPGTSATHLGKAQDAVMGASDTGVAGFFVRRDSPTAVTPIAGDYAVGQIDSTGSQWAHVVMGTTGGATPALLYSGASNNLTSVKGSAGTVTSISATNNHATNYAYLKIYNKATAPVVASDTPIAVFTLGPAGGGVVVTPASGMALGTGIAYAITGAATHTDATNTAVAQVVGCITYH